MDSRGYYPRGKPLVFDHVENDAGQLFRQAVARQAVVLDLDLNYELHFVRRLVNSSRSTVKRSFTATPLRTAPPCCGSNTNTVQLPSAALRLPCTPSPSVLGNSTRYVMTSPFGCTGCGESPTLPCRRCASAAADRLSRL